MTDSDQPKVTYKRLSIHEREGHVIIETPRELINFEPGQAVAFAQALIECAVACGAEVKVEVERPKLTDMQHHALIRRTELVLRSMRDQSPAKAAPHIVDTILAEVLA